MVSISDMQNAADLIRQQAELARALDNLAHNAKIIGVTVSEGEPEGPSDVRIAVMLATADLAWPPQMVQVLKPALEDRLRAIKTELHRLGITE